MKSAQINITVNLKIIPFGQVFLEIKGYAKKVETEKKGFPVYQEPKTTNLQIIEITFGGENYSVPKTTNGFL